MREGNLNWGTFPAGVAAGGAPSALDARLTTGCGRIPDFKFPSRSAPPSKQ